MTDTAPQSIPAADFRIDTTTVNVTVDGDQLAIGLQVHQGGITVNVPLDDDTAHRIGIGLIEAARQVATWGEDDLFDADDRTRGIVFTCGQDHAHSIACPAQYVNG